MNEDSSSVLNSWFRLSKCTKCAKKIHTARLRVQWSPNVPDDALCLACYTSIVLAHISLSRLEW